MNNGLKNKWGEHFKIGAAVNRNVLTQKENDEIIKKHFTSLTAENSMKFGPIHPEENKWNWEEADFTADYARKNNLVMRGHAIIWHNQNPPWLFKDNNETASKTKLYKRLEEHIEKITSRYNDVVYAWDVLNEVIDIEKRDENGLRLTDWLKICGREVYGFAFKKMREAAPNAKLFYNDYNIEAGVKYNYAINFLKSLLDAGAPVDGVGIQGHWYYNYPDKETMKKMIEGYSALGLEIEITEMDISAYLWEERPEEKDYFKSMPKDREEEQSQRYIDIFNLAKEYESVKNITTWGIADNHTWLDHFPVRNRKNWPLLFDMNYAPKEAVKKLCE